MSSIDQQFVEFIVKSIVSKPEAVKIERTIDEKGVFLELTVDPEDLGRVIGKRGATAQSIRSLLRALGTKNDARYNFKIVDNGVPRENSDYQSRPRDDDRSSSYQPRQRDDENNTPSDTKESVDVDKVEDVEIDDIEIPERASHSSVVSKTRKELEELDDLDV